MLTISEIAARLGVSKQAVSKRVKALEQSHGLSVERDGRTVKVDVAQYEVLIGQHGDPLKAQAPQGGQATDGDSFEEARKREVKIRTAAAELRLAADMGQLVRADLMSEALRGLGSELAAVIDRLPNRANDLAQAMAEHGVLGIRKALRDEANRMRRDIAKRFERLAAESPDHDAMEGSAPFLEAAE